MWNLKKFLNVKLIETDNLKSGFQGLGVEDNRERLGKGYKLLTIK